MIVRRKLATARRMRARTVLRIVLGAAARAIYSTETLVVFRMRPGQLRPVSPRLSAGARWKERSAPASASIREVGAIPPHVAEELRAALPGQRLHWIDVDGRIASWGFSTPWQGPWPLTETHTTLAVEAGGVCLTAFETAAAYRGHRLYPSILTRIVEERFAEGAPAAYIWCRASNTASYRAIERVGFEELATHRYVRIVGLGRATTSPIEP